MSKMIVAVCWLAVLVEARAQTPVPPPPPVTAVAPTPPVPPLPPAFPFGAGDDMMMFVSSELGARSVIKGAPYAATAVNETRQTLNDGNRIERSSSIKLYRDSQGRTRQEQPGGAVFINDVVAGKGYVLNTQRKSARELRISHRAPAVPPVPPIPPVPPAGAVPPPPQPSKPHSQMSPEEARSWGEEMRRWGREFAERMRGERGEHDRERNVVISRSITHDTSEGVDLRSDHVQVIRLDGDHASMPSSAMMPPPGPGTTITLGSRDFDGVRADGRKTTWTIPAGRIGNKQPIEIVSERWHSPELNLVVFTRHSDPRSGERLYRLENIKRDEPSAELFKVPGDYTLKAPPSRDSDRK
ncbi:MAG TPA: hypothetical protein VM937_01945 [Burkholderiaceae bacterium]|nr:hypothetical protein [Burkholderiaceae bacterium]